MTTSKRQESGGRPFVVDEALVRFFDRHRVCAQGALVLPILRERRRMTPRGLNYSFRCTKCGEILSGIVSREDAEKQVRAFGSFIGLSPDVVEVLMVTKGGPKAISLIFQLCLHAADQNEDLPVIRHLRSRLMRELDCIKRKHSH